MERAKLTPCKIDGVDETLYCAEVSVPEDRSAAPRASRVLRLHVIVLPAQRGLGSGTPLFDLDGGPGVGDWHVAPLYATELRRLRELGDVVLVDQRGTGYSATLACAALDDAPRTLYPEAEVRACRDALAEHADLRHYGTLDAAADLDAVRVALGYERMNLTSISYGTRLAQVMMRTYPDRLHAVVLFGAVPLDARMPREHALSGQRALDVLLADCASDAECAAAFPRLRDDLEAAATKAGPGFRDEVRHHLYDAERTRGLPKLVHDIAAGKVPATAMDAPQPPRAPGRPPMLSEGVYLSITCNEDVAFIDPEEARRISMPTFFGAERLEVQTRACAQWPHVVMPPGFTDAVASDIPVLAVVGERDPVTPPAWTQRATANMRRTRVLRIPWMGHLPDGLAHLDCLEEVELAFLRDPAAPLDTSCVATMTPPPFVTK
jgi:pimeloyl-ACP methyl ester carboxylesterase